MQSRDVGIPTAREKGRGTSEDLGRLRRCEKKTRRLQALRARGFYGFGDVGSELN